MTALLQPFAGIEALRARHAEGSLTTAHDFGLELAKARAAGADSASISYLIDQLRLSGGAEAIPEPDAWLANAVFIITEPADSQCLNVWREFVVWLLIDPAEGLILLCYTFWCSANPADALFRASIEDVASLFQRELEGETVADHEFKGAAFLAWKMSRDAAQASRRPTRNTPWEAWDAAGYVAAGQVDTMWETTKADCALKREAIKAAVKMTALRTAASALNAANLDEGASRRFVAKLIELLSK